MTTLHRLWLVLSLFISTAAQSQIFVSLSYDDALASQLKYAIPALDRHNFKASFYIVPQAKAFADNRAAWKALASQGHELGNHSMTHPCRGSLPGREWVEPDNDLDTISASQMAAQIKQANAILFSLDGEKIHTLTLPCGDVLAKGENYLPLIANDVKAIKGMWLSEEEEVVLAPNELSGDDLIAWLTSQTDKVKIVNIIFHGVGGDYLTTNTEAHEALLGYLSQHKDKYQVMTYRQIVQTIQRQ